MRKKIWGVLIFSLLLVFAGCIGESVSEKESEESVIVAPGESNDVSGGGKYRYGLIPTPESTYRSFPISGGGKRGELPSSVDLSSKMPNPGNQGNQGSCVGWATAYAYKSFQEKVDQGWSLSTNEHLFSPAYVYNQINGGKDQGSYIHEALKLIVNQGVAPLSSMPYNQYNYTTQPNSSQKAVAANYKAASWSSIPYGDVDKIKSHLAAGDAVVVGIPVYSDFDNISNSNPIYDTLSGSLEGYHAICLVGYDDSKQAFKLINSWGTYWGLSGFGWISYNIIRSQNVEAYVMVDIKTGGNDDVIDDDTDDTTDDDVIVEDTVITGITDNIKEYINFTVYGKGFGTEQTGIYISGEGKSGYAEVLSWSNTEIKVKNDYTAGSYNVWVYDANNQKWSSAYSFEIEESNSDVTTGELAVTGVYAKQGGQFILYGQNFGTKISSVYVYGNYVEGYLNVKSWSNTRIELYNPLRSGKYYLWVYDQNKRKWSPSYIINVGY